MIKANSLRQIYFLSQIGFSNWVGWLAAQHRKAVSTPGQFSGLESESTLAPVRRKPLGGHIVSIPTKVRQNFIAFFFNHQFTYKKNENYV